MAEKVDILTADQYFHLFAVDYLFEKKIDRDLVKSQLLDQFRREMFGIAVMRLKVGMTRDDIDRVIKNIERDSRKKWSKVVKMFETYKESSNLLRENDFDDILNEVKKKTEPHA